MNAVTVLFSEKLTFMTVILTIVIMIIAKTLIREDEVFPFFF